LQLKVNTNNESFGFNALAFNGETPNDATFAGFMEAMFKSSSSSRAGDINVSRKHDGIVIKGLYVGMPIDKAHEIIAGYLDKNWEIEPVKKLDDGDWNFSAKRKDNYYLPNINFWAKQDKKVYIIKLDEDAVNFLFNVSDMSGKEFAQAIVNNYNIPEMEVAVEERDAVSDAFYSEFSALDTGPKMYWQYKDPRGVLLIIKEDKELDMRMIASARERKFD